MRTLAVALLLLSLPAFAEPAPDILTPAFAAPAPPPKRLQPWAVALIAAGAGVLAAGVAVGVAFAIPRNAPTEPGAVMLRW